MDIEQKELENHLITDLDAQDEVRDVENLPHNVLEVEDVEL